MVKKYIFNLSDDHQPHNKRAKRIDDLCENADAIISFGDALANMELESEDSSVDSYSSAEDIIKEKKKKQKYKNKIYIYI